MAGQGADLVAFVGQAQVEEAEPVEDGPNRQEELLAVGDLKSWVAAVEDHGQKPRGYPCSPVWLGHGAPNLLCCAIQVSEVAPEVQADLWGEPPFVHQLCQLQQILASGPSLKLVLATCHCR